MGDAREMELVEEFRTHALACRRAMDKNKPHTANKSSDAMIATYRTMKRELGEPVAALVPLADDPDSGVAVAAAGLLLEHYPEVATPALERLSKSNDPFVSLGAEMTLKVYRTGGFVFPAIDDPERGDHVDRPTNSNRVTPTVASSRERHDVDMTDGRRQDLALLRSRLAEACAAGLSQSATALVRDLARPAVRLRYADTPTASHLGGDALLRPETDWPEWDGTPLSLIAVIDLAELWGFSTDLALPDEGVLNVFYDAGDQCAWGHEPEDRGAWRVILVPRGAVPRSAPPEALVFPTVDLAPEQILTVPNPLESAVGSIVPPPRKRPASRLEALRSSRRHRREQQERDAYFDFFEAWSDGFGAQSAPKHQLGGWPQLQQDEFWGDCDVASQAATSPRHAGNWRLLMQVDTDEEADWMWGDAGMLYFAVQESLPVPQTFEEAWMVLQCG